MPRVSSKTILDAARISKSLVRLLPVCRSLAQASRELEWIRTELPPARHRDAIRQRSQFYPLQYILGSQPFGSLDVLCRRGVLIPRNDTEEWCFEALGALNQVTAAQPVSKVLDVCTGTGCIALAVASEIPGVECVGVDVSERALDLAGENARHNRAALQGSVSFCYGDLFDPQVLANLPSKEFDLVLANPPYIPAREFNRRHGMEKSVRLFEPRLALEGHVEVYAALVDNVVLKSGCKGFIFELAGMEQAEYVISWFKSSPEWTVGFRVDSNGQVRNAIGWKSGFDLESLCTTVNR